MQRLALIVVMMLLAACTRSDAPAAKPTDAPKPAVEAPKPQPAALPADAGGVVALFKARGLPIGDVLVFTGDNDPNKLLGRPNQYTGKVAFLDTRLPRQNADDVKADDGGTVETFANDADLQARRKYVETVTSSASPLAEYAYAQGAVLVRLSKRLTPEQAAQYEALLKNPAAEIKPLPAVAQQAPPTTAPAPPAAKPAEKTAEKPAASTAERVQVVNAGAEGVNMRLEASASSARVKSLRDGTQLEIIGGDVQADGRAWRNVKDPADGAVGWAAAEFLGPVGSPAAKPAAPAAPAPKPAAPAVAPGGGTIICNDGYQWPGTTRQGACNGHGGIRR